MVNLTCYLINRFLLIFINCRTLEEVWSSSTSSYTNVRIFHYPAYVHVNESKLEQRIKKCIFLGYTNRVKG